MGRIMGNAPMGARSRGRFDGLLDEGGGFTQKR